MGTLAMPHCRWRQEVRERLRLQALERVVKTADGHRQLLAFGAVPWVVQALSLEQVLPLASPCRRAVLGVPAPAAQLAVAKGMALPVHACTVHSAATTQADT